MTYYFREIQDQQEMLNWLRLRYTIYNSTRCAGFLTANEEEIDVDDYDLRARHYGLFIEEADEQKLIGGLRIIQNKPVLSSIRMLREMGILDQQKMLKEKAILPIMSYFEEEDNADFDTLVKHSPIATEGSRLVLNKEYQSLRLAKFIISNAIIMHLLLEEDWTAFVSCNPLHARLYNSFGFKNVCSQTTWAKDAPVSALYLQDDLLDVTKREELEEMARAYKSDGFTVYEHSRANKVAVRRTA